MVYEEVMDDEEWVDELPCSSRVLPMPRRWDCTERERQDFHEAWLMVLAEDLRLFLDIPAVKEAYNAYLQMGSWVVHAPPQHDAAGSQPFDTQDFDRYMRSHRVYTELDD